MKTKLDNKRSPLRFYLIIAFIEGAAVMVCELLSARMIVPEDFNPLDTMPICLAIERDTTAAMTIRFRN